MNHHPNKWHRRPEGSARTARQRGAPTRTADQAPPPAVIRVAWSRSYGCQLELAGRGPRVASVTEAGPSGLAANHRGLARTAAPRSWSVPPDAASASASRNHVPQGTVVPTIRSLVSSFEAFTTIAVAREE